jgi:hypothetical protein
MKRIFVLSLTTTCFCNLISIASAATLTWTSAVDTTSSTVNSLRSVDLANDGSSVYIGYIQTSGNREIERHDSNIPYALQNVTVSGGNQPKGIATDDRGNVFVAHRGSGTTSSVIQAYSSTLTPGSTTAATTPVIGGLAIQKSGSNYYAYTVYESGGLIQRYDVTNTGAMTLDATFGTAGSYNIPGATDLRGVEVGSDGSLYVASRGDGKVYKVSSDLSTVTSANLNLAMDVAIFGGNVYATSYNGAGSFIRSFALSDLSTVEDIFITTLDGNPYSRGGNGTGWSGIDIGSDGRIWLVDQLYQTSGTARDRLIVGTALQAVPEPATLVLAGLALLSFVGLARRRK